MGALENIREESTGVVELPVLGPEDGTAAADYRRRERRGGEREEA